VITEMSINLIPHPVSRRREVIIIERFKKPAGWMKRGKTVLTMQNGTEKKIVGASLPTKGKRSSGGAGGEEIIQKRDSRSDIPEAK